MTTGRPKVQFAPDGPLIVEDLTRMRDAAGEVDCKPKMALCRCGGSQNKPFCDGTHAKNGFSSAKKPGRPDDQVDDYSGQAITIHDNRAICAHAGRCTDGLPAVWRMKQEPWIDPDGATAREIVEVIERCPSGALSYTLTDAGSDADAATAAEGPGDECSVFIAPNGPYAVSGPIDLGGETPGEGRKPGRVTLCRCGGSKNKPFCDGTHWNVKFDEAAG